MSVGDFNAMSFWCNKHGMDPCQCGEQADGYKGTSVAMPSSFIVKDSGKRQEFAGGMVRDVTEGKIDYTLCLDGPMFERWAEHMTKGASKYSKRNWMLAQDEAVYERARESALRHFIAWLKNIRDEDHAAAVYFNINLAEYVRDRLLDRAPRGPVQPEVAAVAHVASQQ